MTSSASRRDVEAEHPCGLGADHELELACLYDWQLRWLITLEDAAGISADLTPCIRNVGAVAHQSADFDNFTGVRHQSFETASRANGGRLWLVRLMTLRGSPLVLQAA